MVSSSDTSEDFTGIASDVTLAREEGVLVLGLAD